MAKIACKLIFRDEIVLNKVSNAFVNYVNLKIISNGLHILQAALVDRRS
jgi:hypothetical protein